MPTWLDNIPIIKGQKCAGVHINLLAANKFDISYLVLKKTKSTIEIEKSVFSIHSIQELNEHLDASIPIVLSIGGRGIIHKEAMHDNGEINWPKLFPNTAKKDFYSQSILINENRSFFSIVRKELINSIIQELKQLGLFVVDLLLGPAAINNILPFINNNSKIELPYYEIDSNEDKIKKFRFTGSNECNISHYAVDNEDINSESIILYANALSYFIQLDSINTDFNFIKQEKNEYTYKQLFSKLFLGLIGLLFLILLINYVLFDIYNKKSDTISYQKTVNEGLLTKLENLREDLRIKEEIVENSGVLSSTRWSYYADRIALKLPNNIDLNEMLINPLIKKIDPDNEILFLKNVIEITGETNSSLYFNNWIKILKKESWIEDVEIINYSQENNASKGEFEIIINLMADTK